MFNDMKYIFIKLFDSENFCSNFPLLNALTAKRVLMVMPQWDCRLWTAQQVATIASIFWKIQCFSKFTLKPFTFVLFFYRLWVSDVLFTRNFQQTCRLTKTRSLVCDYLIVETFPIHMILLHYHWTTVGPLFPLLKAALTIIL